MRFFKKVLFFLVGFSAFGNFLFPYSQKDFASSYFQSLALKDNFQIQKPGEKNISLYRKYNNIAFYNYFISSDYENAAKTAMLYLKEKDPEDSVAYSVALFSSALCGNFDFSPVYNPRWPQFNYLDDKPFFDLLETEIYYKTKNPVLYYYYAYYFQKFKKDSAFKAQIQELMLKKMYEIAPDHFLTRSLLFNLYYKQKLQNYTKEIQGYSKDFQNDNPKLFKFLGYQLMPLYYLYKKVPLFFEEVKNQALEFVKDNPSYPRTYFNYVSALIAEQSDKAIDVSLRFYKKFPFISPVFQYQFVKFYFILTPDDFNVGKAPFENEIFKGLNKPPFVESPAGARYLSDILELMDGNAALILSQSGFLPSEVAQRIFQYVLLKTESKDQKRFLFLFSLYRYRSLNKKDHLRFLLNYFKENYDTFKDCSDIYYAFARAFYDYPIQMKRTKNQPYACFFAKPLPDKAFRFLARAEKASDKLYLNQAFLKYEIAEALFIKQEYMAAQYAYTKALEGDLSPLRKKICLLRIYQISKTLFGKGKEFLSNFSNGKLTSKQEIKDLASEIKAHLDDYEKLLPPMPLPQKKENSKKTN